MPARANSNSNQRSVAPFDTRKQVMGVNLIYPTNANRAERLRRQKEFENLGNLVLEKGTAVSKKEAVAGLYRVVQMLFTGVTGDAARRMHPMFRVLLGAYSFVMVTFVMNNSMTMWERFMVGIGAAKGGVKHVVNGDPFWALAKHFGTVGVPKMIVNMTLHMATFTQLMAVHPDAMSVLFQLPGLKSYLGGLMSFLFTVPAIIKSMPSVSNMKKAPLDGVVWGLRTVTSLFFLGVAAGNASRLTRQNVFKNLQANKHLLGAYTVTETLSMLSWLIYKEKPRLQQFLGVLRNVRDGKRNLLGRLPNARYKALTVRQSLTSRILSAVKSRYMAKSPSSRSMVTKKRKSPSKSSMRSPPRRSALSPASASAKRRRINSSFRRK
jgi:hypothetical protein